MKGTSFIIVILLILLCFLVFGTRAQAQGHFPDVFIEVTISFIESDSRDCSQSSNPQNCDPTLTNYKQSVVTLNGIVDNLPKAVFPIPASSPTGGQRIEQVLCFKTNLESLTTFEAEVYGEDMNGLKSPPAFAQGTYKGKSKYCDASTVFPLAPKDFKARNN